MKRRFGTLSLLCVAGISLCSCRPSMGMLTPWKKTTGHVLNLHPQGKGNKSKKGLPSPPATPAIEYEPFVLPKVEEPEDDRRVLSAKELAELYKDAAKAQAEKLERIELARTRKSVEDLMLLRETALSDTDPLSPVAVEVLGQFGTPAAERTIREAVGASRPIVRQASLDTLIRIRSPLAKEPCLNELRNDTLTALTATALRGVRVLGLSEAVPLIIRQLPHAPPALQLPMAEILLQQHNPRGEEILRVFARTDDPYLANAAMKTLSHYGRGGELCYANLRSGISSIRLTALALLHESEPLRDTVQLLPPPQAARAASWYLMLAYAEWGEGACPKEAAELALGGDDLERQTAIRCLARSDEIASVPQLVDAMLLLDTDKRHPLHAALEQKRARFRLNALPDAYSNLETWQAWWFHQHYLLAARPDAARLLLPGGTEATLRTGSRLSWRARIAEIRVGDDQSGTRGGYVRVDTGSRVYRIEPLPAGLRETK